MMIRTLAAGATLAMLVSGAAFAAPQAKAAASIAPKQPIPYGQLDAYLKASPKTRANKDWWSGSAPTGASTNTSATMPAAGSTTTTTDTSVNPPAASTTMPSDSGISPPATPPVLPEGSNPAPGSNLPGSAMTPGAPIEQK